MTYRIKAERSHPASSRRTGQVRIPWLMGTATVVATFGVYTKLPIMYEGQVLVPSAIFVITSWIILAINYSRITFSIIESVVTVVAASLFFGVVSTLSGASGFGSILRGVVQMTFSVTSGVGFFLFLTRSDNRVLAKLSLTIAIIMVIGCALELYTPFKVVSEWVRGVLYDDVRLYLADRRDQFLYGAVRPKLFANEPSNVALFMAVFITSSVILGGLTKARMLWHGILLTIGIFLVRSPILLFCVPIVAIYYFVALSETDALRKSIASFAPRILIFVAMIAGTLGLALFTALIWQGDSNSNPLFRYLQNNSVFFRQVGPFFVMYDIIKAYPISGIGLGNLQGAAPFVAKVYGSYMTVDAYRSVGTLITNNVFLHFMSFGAVGGVAMIVLYSRLLRSLGVRNLTFVLSASALFWQSIGGYQDPRSWWIVFVMAAISVLAPKSIPKASPGRRSPAQADARTGGIIVR